MPGRRCPITGGPRNACGRPSGLVRIPGLVCCWLTCCISLALPPGLTWPPWPAVRDSCSCLWGPGDSSPGAAPSHWPESGIAWPLARNPGFVLLLVGVPATAPSYCGAANHPVSHVDPGQGANPAGVWVQHPAWFTERFPQRGRVCDATTLPRECKASRVVEFVHSRGCGPDRRAFDSTESATGRRYGIAAA